MPDSIRNEVKRMAGAIRRDHGAIASGAASLLHVTTWMFDHYRRHHQVDLTPLLALQRGCVAAYAREQGVSMVVVDQALADLRRANKTLAYLEAVPL